MSLKGLIRIGPAAGFVLAASESQTAGINVNIQEASEWAFYAEMVAGGVGNATVSLKTRPNGATHATIELDQDTIAAGEYFLLTCFAGVNMYVDQNGTPSTQSGPGLLGEVEVVVTADATVGNRTLNVFLLIRK